MGKKSVVCREIDVFLSGWSNDALAVKTGFIRIYRCLSGFAEVDLSFVARPGISYSLRPGHILQQDREFFAVIDVVDDDPEKRWLSVCFYDDLITDPAGRGEVIPSGLPRGNGHCFDVEEEDEELIRYLEERCREAVASFVTKR
jgi:hypothetical protein